MKKNKALLFEYIHSADPEGRITSELVQVACLKGVMIPVNSELAAKGFGFDENISHRFFCKEINPCIRSGNVIRYDNKDYSIVHVADYGKVKVIHLNTLIGRRSVRSVVQNLRY
ncbi:MAG: hypothetical protein BWY15_01087 [Firmicutes bacterium ADurb.Bin193]|nr:MAG: hypothetical protein BWY15_01087 [Firmicutes bacterium ADurb.Bin193]